MTYVLIGWTVGAVVTLILLMRRGKNNDTDSAVFWAIFWPIAAAWATLSRMAS